MEGRPQYKGVDLAALQIDGIAWSEEASDHVRSRPQRQHGQPSLEPEWCTEAALDPRRIVRVAGADKPETASLKVVGFSPSAFGRGEVLKVWIWSDDPHGRTWNGGSGVTANNADRRLYIQGGQSE